MNSGQWLVVILITAAIITMVGLGFRSTDMLNSIITDKEKLSPVLFLIIGFLIILCWIVIVFLIDIYVSMNELRTELDNSQKQLHNDIMKKYTESA